MTSELVTRKRLVSLPSPHEVANFVAERLEEKQLVGMTKRAVQKCNAKCEEIVVAVPCGVVY